MAKGIEDLENLPEITLLEDEGISLEAIQEEMIADYQDAYYEATGEEIVLYPSNSKRLELLVFAGQLFQAYMFGEYMFKQNFLKYMEEDVLKNWGANLGFVESNERASTVTLEFSVNNILDYDVVVPAGTRATAGDNVFFSSEEQVVIKAGTISASVKATCTEKGRLGDGYIVGQINTIADPVPYVSNVRNSTISRGGSDEYSIEELREKIFLYPSTYSVAGPEDAYIYWVKSYSTDIVDVKVVTDESACVNIYIMLSDGQLPGDDYCKAVREYLKGLKKFPDTDKIDVLCPDVVEYELRATYYISVANRANEDVICREVESAGHAFVSNQCERLGVDINTDILVEYIRVAGAKRIDIHLSSGDSASLTYKRLSDSQIAICRNLELVYGGLEED